MKFIVFGASRGVGLKVVEQALEAGHVVTVFVRSPEKFGVKHANLTVFKGNSMDAAAVEQVIEGHEAVISALGPTRPPVPHMMEISAKNIVAAMKKQGINREKMAQKIAVGELLKTSVSNRVSSIKRTQQSGQWTGGSLRVFQAFREAWL
jgi:putative NADH-flavin reductase